VGDDPHTCVTHHHAPIVTHPLLLAHDVTSPTHRNATTVAHHRDARNGVLHD